MEKAMDNKPTVVSLFSGAGGFDWGFHRAGYATLLACEKLLEPATTLAENLNLEIIQAPVAPVLNGHGLMVQGDIQDLDFRDFELNPDVVIGGPPCQDFSMAISKKAEERPGLNGGRGKLYTEFVRALMFLQPKIFVFENVPGLMSANRGTAYKVIKYDFSHLETKRLETLALHNTAILPESPVHGYELLYSDVVNAPSLGISQTRRRLIIIGIREDIAHRVGMNKFQEFSEFLKRELAGSHTLLSKYPLTTLEIFEGKPLSELQDEYYAIMQEYTELAANSVSPTATAWKRDTWNKLTFDIKADYELANQIQNFSETEYEEAIEQHIEILRDLNWLGCPVKDTIVHDNTNDLPRTNKAVTDRMYNIPPGQNYSFVDGTEWQVEGKSISFIYRRAEPLRPAWTVMAYGGGGTYGYHYERHRSQLTLRERARIQTFTDDYLFHGIGVRAQIGEAVPPLMGQKIGIALKQILDELM